MAAIVIDLSQLSSSMGFVVQGDLDRDNAGWSVSSAGDVNADGLDDVIVGAFNGDDGGDNAGEAYVVFGKAGTVRGTVDLSALRSNGFIVQGDQPDDLAGYSVSSAGDINGDGIDDLIVGARRGDDGGDNAGEAYVVFGKAGAVRGTIDLSSLDPADGFIVQGDRPGDNAGWSVSSAGDVNADGLDDLIVGATGGDDGGANAGEAYVVFGKVGATRATVDLSFLGGDGFIIQGGQAGDRAGTSVSSAGDVNGDGIADLIVGAPGDENDDLNSGKAYVVFGKAGATRDTIDLAALDSDGFAIQGDQPGDNAGWSVSSAGDINGDGIDDLIVAANFGDDGGDNAGEAYVIFGKVGAARGDIDLSSLGADGFIIQGDQAGDEAGYSVSSAGDVNGDGFDDLIVGAPYHGGGDQPSAAYVVFGKSGATRDTIDLSTLGDDGFVIRGDASSDQAGFSVSAAGDVNGDGFDDLIVGARLGDDGGVNAGEAYVIYGSLGLGTVERSYTTLTGMPVQFAINGGGPNNASLAFSVDDPAHGAVLDGGNGAFTYIPDPAFSGPDIVTVTVTDGNGGSTVHTIGVNVTALPASDDWKLFADEGYVGEIGGSGTVIGTNASQDITVVDGPGAITFDPSFSRGNDIIRLTGDASDWQVAGRGTSAIFIDGNTFVVIPVGIEGIPIMFDDGSRLLRIDAGAQSLQIGEQDFATTLVSITAPAQVIDHAGVDVADTGSRLYLSEAAVVTTSTSGALNVFGTTAAEEVHIGFGDVRLDQSFELGGDLLILDQTASQFTAVRTGLSLQLASETTDVLIPLGMSGMTVSFFEGDDCTLVFDPVVNTALLADQSINFAVVPVSEFA